MVYYCCTNITPISVTPRAKPVKSPSGKGRHPKVDGAPSNSFSSFRPFAARIARRCWPPRNPVSKISAVRCLTHAVNGFIMVSLKMLGKPLNHILVAYHFQRNSMVRRSHHCKPTMGFSCCTMWHHNGWCAQTDHKFTRKFTSASNPHHITSSPTATLDGILHRARWTAKARGVDAQSMPGSSSLSSALDRAWRCFRNSSKTYER